MPRVTDLLKDIFLDAFALGLLFLISVFFGFPLGGGSTGVRRA